VFFKSGNIVAKIAFAYLQSSATGGYGVAAVPGVVKPALRLQELLEPSVLLSKSK
jgi:hypothetical protein